ncbi:hypothetical protein Enr10x_48600 [Gimesia panareensis]|uniref:Transglutaminase-like superfamily protein n=1 Tax=Gimesia panareensis TaxID=2527978 RepID=A0A517QD37_9PLAN|nr:hypothetical protein [Gimesia panareensis]QDT29505.1 hypothetical protein Enr10x_48600 [Gimesia panareensis]
MTLTALLRPFSRNRQSVLPGVCLCCLLICLSGCKPPKPAKKAGAGGKGGTTTATTSVTQKGDSECLSYIDNSINMMQPKRLGISSGLKPAVSLLNEWAESCGNFDAKPPTVTDSQKPFLQKYLSEAQLAKMDLTRFTEIDGNFIRDSQLFNGMVSAAIEGKKNDLERTTAAFYYTVNNIDLVPEEKNALPLSPYEICVIGSGTAQQRAWIFIDLMRQLRIDAVLFRPAKPAPFKLLVGVLLEDKIYLYDPVLGLPIPAPAQPADTIQIQMPATFAEVQQDPDLLKKFYGKYTDSRFSAEELKTAQVEILGRSSEWSTRMRRLEDSLSRKQTFVLYRNLDPLEGDPGFIGHIQSIGKGMLKDNKIVVSEYPDNEINASEAISGEQAKTLSLIKLPFRAPVPYDAKQAVENAQGFFEVKWGAPTKKLLKTRLSQLLGEQQAAIKSYVSTRLEERFPADLVVPPEIRQMHVLAGQNAAYFIGIGQFIQEEYAVAAQSFDSFLRHRFYIHRDSQGKWLGRSLSVLYHMAIADAESGKINSAIFSLSENENKGCPDAMRPAFAFFSERWKIIRDKNK